MSAIRVYEHELDMDVDRAMREAAMYFEEKNTVHLSLRSITEKLDALNIPYVVVGGMAMFLHGYRRFTEDVDLLVTPEGLKAIHEALEGRGYLPPFTGSKQLRDTVNGVRIEFLVTGGFPGDGKPKPVAFPDPVECSQLIGNMRCLKLENLLELKLASGMTNPGRLKDLADVQEMIRHLNLPLKQVDSLNPYVQEKFREMWNAVRNNKSDPE